MFNQSLWLEEQTKFTGAAGVSHSRWDVLFREFLFYPGGGGGDSQITCPVSWLPLALWTLLVLPARPVLPLTVAGVLTS